MARIGDRRHPRHIEILRLKPIIQLRGHGTQDIQPLRRPMRERIRQRQHIEKRYMTHAWHHAQSPFPSYTSIIIPMRQKIQYVENISFPFVWSSLGEY